MKGECRWVSDVILVRAAFGWSSETCGSEAHDQGSVDKLCAPALDYTPPEVMARDAELGRVLDVCRIDAGVEELQEYLFMCQLRFAEIVANPALVVGVADSKPV